MTRHLIETIKYLPGVAHGDAPLTCTCGWTGRAGDFAHHRNPGAWTRDDYSAQMAKLLAEQARARQAASLRAANAAMTPEQRADRSQRVSDGMRGGKRRKGAA